MDTTALGARPSAPISRLGPGTDTRETPFARQAQNGRPNLGRGPGEMYNRKQEAEEQCRAADRNVEAMARRGEGEDPERQLRYLLRHHDHTADLIRGLVTALHEAGYSWQEIADAVGLSREQVRKTWGRSGR